MASPLAKKMLSSIFLSVALLFGKMNSQQRGERERDGWGGVEKVRASIGADTA